MSCSCDPAAVHSVHCEATPIFTQVAYEMTWSPTLPCPELGEDPFFFGRWVCYYSGEPHFGGYINGPTHYCPRLHTVVMQEYADG